MYMSRQIMISDTLYQQLKEQADKNCRTMAGQIQFLVGTPIELPVETTRTISVVPSSVLRTVKDVLKEINELEKEINSVDETNQDPDYWQYIKEQTKTLENKWKEWHTLTGK